MIVRVFQMYKFNANSSVSSPCSGGCPLWGVGGLYVIVILVMAMATFVCESQGQEYASVHIYGSWWFTLLWAMLAASGIVYILMCKVKNIPVVALHLSFVLILAGALLTHTTSSQGVIHLREGDKVAFYEDNKGECLPLPFTISLRHFDVSCRPGTDDPMDFSTTFLVNDNEEGSVSMNRIKTVCGYRLCQSGYDSDLAGSYLSVNYDPYGIPVTYTGYILLAISFILLMIRKPQRKLLYGALVLNVIIAYLFSLKDYNMPVLNTWLLPVHVSLIVTAYVLLIVSVWKRNMLVIALGLLSMGIFVGAVWANISWGNYWEWDPKEVWALITLMVYAIPLHCVSIPAFRNIRAYRIYMIVAFLAVLMTYFGVNYFLSGMHSYA